MTIKEKFMKEMMENQCKNMTSEQKKQMMEAMMEKFFINV